ncbi:MAG: hypothetical protein WKG32_05195 [Gemmatimonadaceae bacterium]
MMTSGESLMFAVYSLGPIFLARPARTAPPTVLVVSLELTKMSGDSVPETTGRFLCTKTLQTG